MKKKVAFAILILVFLSGAIAVFMARTKTPQTESPIPKLDTRTTIEKPSATATVGKSYQFSLDGQKGKQADTFTYTLDTVELRNEIIVQGKKKSIVSGKTFFIVNLKLTNETTKFLSIDTRSYIRLSTNSRDTELLAPEIYNNPEQIQPVSTKITRVGFTINESDRDLKLHVGELSKEKNVIEIKFP